MRRSLPYVACIALLCSNWAAHSDEPPAAGAQPLLQTLPKEGAWVTYFVTIAFDGNEEQPRWRAASVGTKTIDGEPHRWLELSARNDAGVYVVYKGLVPESAFGPGKNPLEKVTELWVREGRGEPRRIARMEESDPYITLILGGPVNGVRKLDEKRTVPWQKGRLECDVWEGRSELDAGFVKLTGHQQVLRNDAVPFGVAGAEIELRANDRGVKVEFSLTDMGTGAKSLLPNVE